MKKQLGFFGVFAVCSGAMISSGLFVLPAIAAAKVGSAVVFTYIVSGVLLIPAMLATAEMATAMPRTGGTYFFISRTLGGMCGTIEGIGVWFSLILKASIALLGLGAYLFNYIHLPIPIIAIGFAILFTILNLLGTKETVILQNGMVIMLLLILSMFVFGGIKFMNFDSMPPFPGEVLSKFLPTVALVFVSYIGVTKVASIAEEVKNPEKNIPAGMIVAWFVVLILYACIILIVIKVVPMNKLVETVTPLADAAYIMMGSWAGHVIGLAAALAFATTANAGILAASRYLLAMGRDQIIPSKITQESRFGTPVYAILLTSVIILLFVISSGFERIAKLASTFQLLGFALINVSVIVMRESKIKSYDPGFKSPLYPYLQILGVIISVVLIPEMGILSSIFTLGLIALGIMWYYFYAVKRSPNRVGAVAKMTERLAEKLLEKDANVMGLRTELRQIIKEKNLRESDPFFKLIQEASYIELDTNMTSKQVIELGAKHLSKKGNVTLDLILGAMLERNRLGETPASSGVALPHVLLDDYEQSHMVIMRSKQGIKFHDIKTDGVQDIYAVFMLLGSQKNPSQHLRILAEIARRAGDPHFIEQWQQTSSVQELSTLFLSIKVES